MDENKVTQRAHPHRQFKFVLKAQQAYHSLSSQKAPVVTAGHKHWARKSGVTVQVPPLRQELLKHGLSTKVQKQK